MTRTPLRLHRSARIPEGTSSRGTTAAYAAAITPMLAAVKPISLMKSFSTGTHSIVPCSAMARCSGRKRERSARSEAVGSRRDVLGMVVRDAKAAVRYTPGATRIRRPAKAGPDVELVYRGWPMAIDPAKPALPADQDLVARLCAGDEHAFALVLDAWSDGMTRVARTFVSTDASAAEVVQEAWLSVVRAIASFEGRSSLRTWVYRILVNAAKRRAAQEGRSLPFSSLSPDADAPTVDPESFQGRDEPFPGHWRTFPAPWPDEALLTKEVHEVVRQLVDGLPPQQRAVIALRDIEGCSAEETCELLGLTPGNQRVLLHRARAGVRRDLAAYLGSADERAPHGRGR